MRDPTEAPEIGRLKRRADFLRVGKGKRWHAKALTVQAAAAPDPLTTSTDRSVRIGFTLTRKVGGAVVRNRARRRLKEAVRLSDGLPVKAGHDYVIVGRIDAVRLTFQLLRNELLGAFHALQSRPGPKKPDRNGPPLKSIETR